MARKQIFSVGYDFPGDEVENIEFLSDHSLLEADIVIYQPSFKNCHYKTDHEAKPWLTDKFSIIVHKKLKHWFSQMKTIVEAGKVVIVFLAKPEEVIIYAENRETSSLGLALELDKEVQHITSYNSIPLPIQPSAITGTGCVPCGDLGFLTSYWREFKEASPYQATIEGTFTNVLLKTQLGDRIVGAVVRQGQGAYILLPPVQYDKDNFIDYVGFEGSWNEEGEIFGNRLANSIVSLVAALKAESEITPPPDWSKAQEFRLPSEDVIQSKLDSKTKEIERATRVRDKLQSDLSKVGELRRLLFEKGKQLEFAIIDALNLFGFKADQFDDGDSEFDAIFTSPEGRFLGEAEGKDNKAINIDKLSQLERNLQEDFARKEVNEFANGVLFGNAYRLDIPEGRKEAFTTKCLAGAKRSGTALVRTPDLFLPAKYLKMKSDKKYAEQCRKAILNAKGTVVEFTTPPVSSSATAVVEPKNLQASTEHKKTTT